MRLTGLGLFCPKGTPRVISAWTGDGSEPLDGGHAPKHSVAEMKRSLWRQRTAITPITDTVISAMPQPSRTLIRSPKNNTEAKSEKITST